MRIKNGFSLTAVAVAVAMMAACGGESDHSADDVDEAFAPDELLVDNSMPMPVITDADTVNPWNNVADSLPGNCVKLRTRYLGDLRELFNDSNHVHYPVAERQGIEPIMSNADAWNVRRPLVKVGSCRDFYVQELHHSVPYLIPSAAECLHEIGSRFNDSLQARGGGSYRIKVTSVLRTKSSVQRLRRVNRNAVDSSTHQFATTFDISTTRFVCDNVDDVNRTVDDLHALLAEVLADMQREKKIYIKLEKRNGCFHITSRMGDKRKKG